MKLQLELTRVGNQYPNQSLIIHFLFDKIPRNKIWFKSLTNFFFVVERLISFFSRSFVCLLPERRKEKAGAFILFGKFILVAFFHPSFACCLFDYPESHSVHYSEVYLFKIPRKFKEFPQQTNNKKQNLCQQIKNKT